MTLWTKVRAGALTCPYIPFLIILGFGVFLRFHALDRQSLWDDEMSTLHTISLAPRAQLHRFATYETHPPLYFLQLKLWRAAHLRSLVKLRANSALWGSLSLLLIFVIGRRYGGDRAGLMAMALLALSPFHIAYSQEMRPYAFGIAISLAALLALERQAWILLGVLWTALLYTHYWGAFVVLAQMTYGCLACQVPPRRPGGMTSIIISAATAAILFSFWLPILLRQLSVVDGLGFWVPAFSLQGLGKTFLAYSGILFNMASWTFYLPGQVWLLGLIGLVFLTALIQGIRQGPKAGVFWLFIGLLTPWLLSAWKPSLFVWYRYPVLMLPAFILLVSSGILTMRFRVLRMALLAACLASQGWGAWVYFHGWQKANPKAVMQYVRWLRQADTVVIRPAYFSDLFAFYDQNATPALDEDTLDSPEKRAALKGHNIIFLAFDVPSDPVGEALLKEFKPESARYFPGTAHLGITVYQLR